MGDRILRESCGLRGNEHVARRLDQLEVRPQYHGDDRAKATTVERIILDDEKGSAETRFGAAGLVQIGPPDLAPFDYHRSESTERRCARRTGESSPLG